MNKALLLLCWLLNCFQIDVQMFLITDKVFYPDSFVGCAVHLLLALCNDICFISLCFHRERRQAKDLRCTWVPESFNHVLPDVDDLAKYIESANVPNRSYDCLWSHDQ